MDRLRGGQIRIGCASGLGTEFAIAISGTSRLFPCARACPSVLREGWGRGKREATPASLPGERDKKDSGLASERERDHRRRLTDRDGDGDDLVSPFPTRGGYNWARRRGRKEEPFLRKKILPTSYHHTYTTPPYSSSHKGPTQEGNFSAVGSLDPVTFVQRTKLYISWQQQYRRRYARN